MGTKGTWRRPAAVDDDQLEEQWRRTFGLKCSGFQCAAGGDCPKCDPAGPEVAEPTEKH